ncbi:MAG TPA: hypothetical protein VEZ71_24625 [Archangium sp.]|nr:hypothetical protein [Archangium sp.]
MFEHDDFLKNLMDAPWRLYKKVTVEGRSGPVELDIRIPPPAVLEELQREAKALKDEANEENPDALNWLWKVVATTVWRPGAVRQLLTPDQVKHWPQVSLIQGDCVAALNTAMGVEAAKGK